MRNDLVSSQKMENGKLAVKSKPKSKYIIIQYIIIQQIFSFLLNLFKNYIVKRVARLANSQNEEGASLEDLMTAVTIAENEKQIETTIKALKK